MESNADDNSFNGFEQKRIRSSPEKTFKILSLDGGGIKGLYPARILQLIEKRYKTNIADHFNMICGTSTGGLIALALSINKPASEIVSLYQNKGQIIFPQPKTWFGKKIQMAKQLLFGGKYNGTALERVLYDFFGDITLKEASTLLCIPSFNLTIGMPRVFKKPHHKLFKDANIKMKDAALATSAAPSLLPIHQINNALYCDGGMWANNPALCGLLEALEFFVGKERKYDSYSILSFPTIPPPTGWAETGKKRKSLKNWGEKIFQPAMEGQAYFADFFLKKIVNYTNSPGYYQRVKVPDLSAKQIEKIALDNTSNEALNLLTEFGDQIGSDLLSKGVFDKFIKPKTAKIKEVKNG